jgi:hypothetical protein
MNTRKLILLILLLLLFAWGVWFWYPTLEPFLTHQKTHGLLEAIVFPSTAGGREITTKDNMLTPAGWILLVLLALAAIVVFPMKVGPSKAHGSARAANRRDTRNYRARRSTPRIFRPGLAGLLAPASRALSAYRAGSSLLAQKKATEEQRLLLGRYGLSTISLPQWLQQQNVLLTAMIGSGKTFGLIMRNLLRECGRRSLFISDVKAELVRKTAGYLSQCQPERWLQPAQACEKCTRLAAARAMLGGKYWWW